MTTTSPARLSRPANPLESPSRSPRSSPGSSPSSKTPDREIKAITGRLKAVETQIATMERRLAEISLSLSDPDLYRDGERAREIARARKDAEGQVAWLMK